MKRRVAIGTNDHDAVLQAVAVLYLPLANVVLEHVLVVLVFALSFEAPWNAPDVLVDPCHFVCVALCKYVQLMSRARH